MTINSLVQARIAGDIKEEASAVLAAMGLTVSDAVRLLLIRVAHDQSLPFEPLSPTSKTIEAMKKARKRKGKSFKTVAALMKDLNEND